MESRLVINRSSRGRLSDPPAEILGKILGRLRAGGGQQINLHGYIQRIREFCASSPLQKPLAADLPKLYFVYF